MAQHSGGKEARPRTLDAQPRTQLSQRLCVSIAPGLHVNLATISNTIIRNTDRLTYSSEWPSAEDSSGHEAILGNRCSSGCVRLRG